MRIEQLVRQLPDQVFGTSSRQGKIALRLWGIVALAETDEMPILRKHVLRAQRVYSLTSEYLHSRRAGLVPPPTELMIWQEDIASLETAVQHLMAPPN
ncbi:hypothetical protein [Amycolatopsis sp. La24]|uniref:hypothetical protein n=1 Tax=Amycolatopsis sp. La24 TaxID=3028304 RepID=UPI0023B1648E|nr:hypothetical protein [Amycolatopsis sp. La24]